MRWHVVFSEGRLEVKICGEIERLGFKAFVPIEKRKRFRRGKRYVVARPLFPSYLFAQFDSQDAKWNRIRDIEGVLDILSNQGQPIAVPIGLTEKLQRMQHLGYFDHTKPPNPFPPGTDVLLDKEGPFAGFAAKVLRVRTADRAELLLRFLNKELTINVGLARLTHI